MSLLGLPLELFHMVVAEALPLVAMPKAVRLRLVCKLFDSELQRALLALPVFNGGENAPSQEGYASYAFDRLPNSIGTTMAVRLIEARLTSKDADRRPLCEEITRTVSFLQHELGQSKEESMKLRNALIWSAATQLSLKALVSLIAPRSGEIFAQDPDGHLDGPIYAVRQHLLGITFDRRTTRSTFQRALHLLTPISNPDLFYHPGPFLPDDIEHFVQLLSDASTPHYFRAKRRALPRLGPQLDPMIADELGLSIRLNRDSASTFLLRRDANFSLRSFGAQVPSISPHQTLNNALIAAIYTKQMSLVEQLLDRGADALTWNMFFGSPFAAASTAGSLQILRSLLRRGLPSEYTPASKEQRAKLLLYAASWGHSYIIDILLHEYHPVRYVPNDIHLIAIQYALAAGHERIVAHMTRHGLLYSPAITRGGLEIDSIETAIRAAARHVCPLAPPIPLGGHPSDLPILFALLQLGVTNDRLDLVRAVLSMTNVNIRPYSRLITWAAQYGNNAMIDLLIHHGADVNGEVGPIIDGKSLHPIIYAAYKGAASTIRHLLKKGASMPRDEGVEQALANAIVWEYKNTVRALRDAGLDVGPAVMQHVGIILWRMETRHRSCQS